MHLFERINKALSISETSKEEHQETKSSGYPTPGEMLYQPPNPDGSRKKCGNCFMFCKEEDKCLIFKKGQKVVESQICRYYVFGTPRNKWQDMGIDPIDTKMAGLEEVGEGTSCDNCEYFNKNKCYRVAPEKGKEPPTPVDPLSCCNGWEKK